jgi:hypothetical protein
MFGKNGGRFDGAITPSIKRKGYVWNYNALNLEQRDFNEYQSDIYVANSRIVITRFRNGSYYRYLQVTDIKTGEVTKIMKEYSAYGRGIACKSKKDDDIQYVQEYNYLTTFDMINYTQNRLSSPPYNTPSHVSIHFDNKENPNIYAFVISDGYDIACFLYDKVNNAWIPKAKSSPRAIMLYGDFTCAVDDGFLIFGTNDDDVNSNTVMNVYKYSISLDTFSFVASSKLKYYPPIGTNHPSLVKNTFLNGDKVNVFCWGCSFQFDIKTLQFSNNEYCSIVGSAHGYDRIFTVPNEQYDGLGEITFIK